MSTLSEKTLQELDDVYGNNEDDKAKHRELLEAQAKLPVGIRYACRNWMFMPVGVAKKGDVVREDDGEDNDVEWELGDQLPQSEYEVTLQKFDNTTADCFQIRRCVGATLPPSAGKFKIIRFNSEKFSDNLHIRCSQNPGEDCVCCKWFGFKTSTDAHCCCPIEVEKNPHRRYATAMDRAGD